MSAIRLSSVAAIIHACTTNDVNGNPRRCWVLLNRTGGVIDVADEGYSGAGALASILGLEQRLMNDAMNAGKLPYDFHLNVTPAEYKRLTASKS